MPNEQAKKLIPENRQRPSVETVILVLLGLTMLLPFAWLVSSALRPEPSLCVPPIWIPEVPQWQNFIAVFREVPLLRFYFNSFVTAGG